MKKLFKAFKKLPPEARMVLAVIGLGSPLGAIYFLRRMFPGVSLPLLILCVVGGVLAIALVIWLIMFVFTRGRKKRTSRMASELAGEGQAGPQSVDVSAAIKANNEKFFNAMRDLKKNVGISPFDLPWYIVIGDSGCGKTKLVNEGGLTFSTGKPEGYQLGTLNYNWWFTEDAIFVDMAGRLCNPQDDSDRREWSSFLDTIAKGRKGFPINGAIVCVSAEHLLQDPPEKHESDANVSLERLRDLQTKLGVTFATYLVVTKCDKILGFMQFFDRAERDITVKNQIFGWSKPGDFGELYDPERFKADFNDVYVRLNELRVRRMNDEAEEIDLGLAYSFPEEFRQLHEPLQTYVRTLFPFIRNPRAVKNLLFRGVYFTSATQEGELILKHLTERLGTDAAGQFAPLDDLYPNKRPHFIKDVLFRKVFPEHGLVFRNEGQVIRHKKLNKVLKVGTAVLTVLLVAAFWWSSSTFTGIIGEPRSDAKEAAEALATMTPAKALAKAGDVQADVRTLDENRMAARILSLGMGTTRPVQDLEHIRRALVEKSVVQALEEVGVVLRSKPPLQSPGTPQSDAYLAALEQYIAWFGCRGETESSDNVTLDGFETLCEVLTRPDSIIKEEGFAEQTKWYFRTISQNEELSRNPAQLLGEAGIEDAAGVINVALDNVYEHYTRYYATLGRDSIDPSVGEWMRLREACLTVDGSYDAMLLAAAAVERVETLEGLDEFKGTFLGQFDAFDEALNGLKWQVGGAGTLLRDIRSLSDLIWDQRKKWVAYQQRLDTAARTCGAEDAEVLAAIDRLRAGDSTTIKGLDRVLWDSLRESGIVSVAYSEDAYLDREVFDRQIAEVPESFSEILRLTPGDSETISDEIGPTEGAMTVRALIRQIRDRLVGAVFAVPEDLRNQNPTGWIDALDRHTASVDAEAEPIDVTTLSSYWRPEALSELHGRCRDLIQLGEGTRLLKTILARLAQVQDPESWGYAALGPYNEWSTLERSPFTIPRPERPAIMQERSDEVETPDRTTPPVQRERQRPSLRPSQRTGGRERGAPTTDARTPGRTRGVVGQVPVCATHEHLNNQAQEWVELVYFLEIMRGQFLPDAESGELLNVRCLEELEKSVRVCMTSYIGAWSQAYGRKELKTLERIRESASSWERLAVQLGSQPKRRRVSDELIPALSTILQAVPYANHLPDGTRWDFRGDGEWLRVSAWMEDSVGERWDTSEYGLFAVSTRTDGGGASLNIPPWQVISGDFEQAWMELAEDMAAIVRIPPRFSSDVDWHGTHIRWGALEKLREEYALTGEKLSGELVAFERQAQGLLSSYLTETLCGIQQHFLGNESPFDGWPFLPGEEYTRNGLDAVEFDSFLGFLVEVHRAKTAFEEVESGLPGSAPGHAARQSFYTSCEQWFNFLGLKDEPNPSPEALQLTVLSEDPLSQPFGKETVSDTCQHTARWLEVDLGLVLGRDATASGTGILQIACERQYKRLDGHYVRWPWDAKPGKLLTVGLKDPLPGVRDPGSPKTLGTYSPLALCAYLHRYGVGQDQDKTWYVTHSFTDPQTEDSQNTVGDKLVFRLVQPLPEPIVKLTKVSAQARGTR